MSRAIDEERYRAGALSTLAPHLPETLKEKVLSKALTAARAIDDEDHRAQALSGLVPLLVTLSSHTLFQLWRTMLRLAAGRTRANLLSDIQSLVPVIAALGQQEIMPEVFHSIQEMGTWQF